MPPGIGYPPPNAGAVPLDPVTGLPMLEPGLGGGLAPPQMRTPPNRPPGPGGPPPPGGPPGPGMGMQPPGGPPGPGTPPMPGGGAPMPGQGPIAPPGMGAPPGQGPQPPQQPQQLMQGGGAGMGLPPSMRSPEMMAQLNQMRQNDPEGYEQFVKGLTTDYGGLGSDLDKQQTQAQALRDTELKGGYGGGGSNFVSDNPLAMVGVGMKQYAGRQQAQDIQSQREAAQALRSGTLGTQIDMERRAGG